MNDETKFRLNTSLDLLINFGLIITLYWHLKEFPLLLVAMLVLFTLKILVMFFVGRSFD